MSYITSSLSPYRSKDLGKEIEEIFSEDYDYVCSSFEEKGFWFLLALVSVMFLSVLKAIVFFFEQKDKPVMTYSHLGLHRGMQSESITDILTRRESTDEVENHDNLCPNTATKNKTADSFITLRNYLYQHDLTLHIETIKEINHRISEEELAEMYRLGKITKPLSTTHITCGDNLNKLLKEVLGDTIDLKTNKITQETYIKVINDDFYPIQTKLEEIYMEHIKLKFD